MTSRDWDRAFHEFMSVRDRVVVRDDAKDKKPPVAPDPAPEPTQRETPSAEAKAANAAAPEKTFAYFAEVFAEVLDATAAPDTAGSMAKLKAAAEGIAGFKS